jgi:Asp-tRNA(Asn)/Glu-tRNA(Gln) amidotransferase A subunit family amidase
VRNYVTSVAPLPPGQIERGFMLEARIYATLGTLFETYRALLCPTLAIPALPAGADQPDPLFDTVNWSLVPGIAHLMTLPFNICNRCPVIAVPSEIGANGVPTGVQIVGPTYLDRDVFEVAAALEQQRPWLDTPARRPALPATNHD